MYLGTDIILHVKQIKYYFRKTNTNPLHKGWGQVANGLRGKRKSYICTVAHTMVITTVCYCYVLEQA